MRSEAFTPDAGPTRRGNRRRLLVFTLTFAAALLLGQAWNFSRPAEYRASTRLQVDLPEAGRPGPSASGAYLSKLQLLDSRPLLAHLSDALLQSGVPPAVLGNDPAGRLQSMLQVRLIAGSEVVEVQATGSDPRLLADVLKAYPEAIQQGIASRQSAEADAQLAAARAELARLERTATERRRRLDAFRQNADVLAERDENEAMARMRGLNAALDAAVEKEAAAAARLTAVTRAVEQGKSSTQARADPALSALETRAHQLKEQMRELERTYTADFLAMDPQARSLRARVVELDSQIVVQRGVALQAALQSAQEEQAGAQAQVDRLRAQLRAARPMLAKTSARFGEAKVLEDDLAQVDKARRELLERVSRLEADDARRVAAVMVIEPASVPAAPFRPDRVRDGALALAGAAALALLLTGTVELFNRAAPPAAVAPQTNVLLTPGWAPRDALPAGHAVQALAPGTATGLPSPPGTALPAPWRLLSQPEAAALLAAGRGRSRLLCALALMGLSTQEALSLRRGDVDADPPRLKVGGAWARELPMPSWMPALMPALLSAAAAADEPLLQDAGGHGLSADDIAPTIVGAALDARLDDAPAVGWQTLRDTAVDWLVGQGLPFGDLPRAVGRVDAAELQALAARHGDTRRREAEDIDPLMPALRLDPAA